MSSTRNRHYRVESTSNALKGHSVGFCDHCQKMVYTNRADARYASRNRYPGEKLRVYACGNTEGWYHIGNLQLGIKQGKYHPREAA